MAAYSPSGCGRIVGGELGFPVQKATAAGKPFLRSFSDAEIKNLPDSEKPAKEELFDTAPVENLRKF